MGLISYREKTNMLTYNELMKQFKDKSICMIYIELQIKMTQTQDKCINMCYINAQKFSYYQKLYYILNEPHSFGYFGINVFKPSNLCRVDAIFYSRFIENCRLECLLKYQTIM